MNQTGEESKQTLSHIRSWTEEAADHANKVDEFLQNCLFRGCQADSTVRTRASVLRSMFRRVEVEDARCPGGKRHLFIWELLDARTGPGYLSAIINSLLADNVAPGTRRKYMNDLRAFCEYVVAKPNLIGEPRLTLSAKYGPITLTFTKFDLPIHSADKPVRKRYALSVAIKIAFIEFLRTCYLPQHPMPHIAARDYAMIVLQVEIGARASEVLGIRVSGTGCDIDHSKGRVRLFGKGRRYSGKRIRWASLTPLAKEVLHSFEKVFRPMTPGASQSDFLFLNEEGKQITARRYSKMFRKVIELATAAGVMVPKDLVPHDLRRTYATNEMSKNPMLYWKILKQLGHSWGSSAAPYLICTDDEAVEELDDLLDIFIDPDIDMVR